MSLFFPLIFGIAIALRLSRQGVSLRTECRTEVDVDVVDVDDDDDEEEIVMKNVFLVVVALLSVSRGVVADDFSLSATGQKDPWKNGVIPGSALDCERVGIKKLPNEQNSGPSAPKSSSRSASAI